MRSSSPAPHSRSTAADTSPTTSRLRNRPLPRVDVRPSEERTWTSEALVACHAGASPNSRPVRKAVPAQKATIRSSKERITAGGSRPAGMTEGATERIAAPTPRPRAPPSAASTRLSVRICTTIRPRPAPSADRRASSRARPLVRASRRLATFAQHMSRTKPTTPSSRYDVRRTSGPMRPVRSGSIVTPRPVLVAGTPRPGPRPPSSCRFARHRW